MASIKQLLISKDSSIKATMRLIDRNSLGVAFVVDKDKRLFGIVTDGDIRRAILRGLSIDKPIEKIANKNPIVIHNKFREKEILDLRNNKETKKKIPIDGSLKIPVLDENSRIKDIIFISSQKEGISRPLSRKSKIQNGGVKKVLVIGGAGYLGSVLCSILLGRGYRVRVLDNLTYGDLGIRELKKNKNFEFFKGDIRNIPDVIEAIKGVDAVIHLAGIVGDPACKADPEKTLESNYLATKIIVETCKYFQINRFIFASTCSVYGESLKPNEKLTEKSPLNPVSLYAETKIKCEQSILEAVDENFSPAILRMATLYGYSPAMRFDLAVNSLTAKAIFDKKIPIFGGNQWRPWLALEDATEAYILCLEAPIEKIKGEIFNVLSENYRVIEIGKIIQSVCPDAQLEINNRIVDQRNYNVSFQNISQILNFRPKQTIRDGVSVIQNAIRRGLVEHYKNPKYRTSVV